MREIVFYRTESGASPVEDFFDSLSGKQAQKVIWVLSLIQEVDPIPSQYSKKPVNTDDIWEVRIQVGNNIFRLLGFPLYNRIIVLTNGFAKKTQKTPSQEIHLAEQRKRDYLRRNLNYD